MGEATDQVRKGCALGNVGQAVNTIREVKGKLRGVCKVEFQKAKRCVWC